MKPTFTDVELAYARIQPYIKRTPLLTSPAINALTGAQLYFKCENLQDMGAFKIRGASNAVFSLSDDEASKGVATHSSGNHATALALAAKIRGIPAHIVMPSNAARVKQEAVAAYGAHIYLCEPAERESALQKVVAQTGAHYIPSYNDERIIAGQATAALELIEQYKQFTQEPLDMIITPIGGGGLISGTCISTKALSPQTQVIGAEPLGANDAYQSFQSKAFVPVNNPQTICDGLRTSLGTKTLPFILEYVSDILTATEFSILAATQLIWERMKIIVEPSSAVTLAIVLEHPDYFKNKTVGLVLTGGNVDIKALALLFS